MGANDEAKSRAVAWRLRLNLRPHPEGGWFREVFGEKATVEPEDGRGTRRALTAIYYLLEASQYSRWHRVRSAEAWTLLDGGPLALAMFDAEAKVFGEHRLAADANEEKAEPLRVVPAGVWQAAYPLGEYALMACVVGPGFDWADFSWLKDDAAALAAMRAQAPGRWGELV
ncbi:MAG: cupin domain-containing protein [Opitutales bacterium]|jgi:predicted cupin superfamily sugar epimerase